MPEPKTAISSTDVIDPSGAVVNQIVNYENFGPVVPCVTVLETPAF